VATQSGLEPELLDQQQVVDDRKRQHRRIQEGNKKKTRRFLRVSRATNLDQEDFPPTKSWLVAWLAEPNVKYISTILAFNCSGSLNNDFCSATTGGTAMRIVGNEIPMKSLLLAYSFVSFVLFGQSVPIEVKSAKQVLEDFVKSDLDGGRLTEKGPSKLSHFFIQRSEPQKDYKIVIVSPEYDLRETKFVGNRAEFQLQFLHFYGKLDSASNFEPAADATSNGVPIKGGILSSFVLVRFVKGGESAPNTQEKTKVDGPAEWKIDRPQPPICISLATAIHYLTKISKTDSDPTRRKNAARALAKLRNVH